MDKTFKNFNDRDLHRMKQEPSGVVYIAIWKASKDPKLEILFSKPDPEKWDFVECKVVNNSSS